MDGLRNDDVGAAGAGGAPRPAGLDEAAAGRDPWALFRAWMGEAERAEINDPNAMALATVDPDGMPNVRVVLLKGVDARGFVFYTNTLSQKGRELGGTAKAALVLHWKSLRRQVRARGPITFVADDEADAYFASRARGSRIGAWASRQSETIASRAALEAEVARLTAEHEGREVPRPPHWTGYRLTPERIEFWHDQPSRLHDRLEFRRAGGGDEDWEIRRLSP